MSVVSQSEALEGRPDSVTRLGLLAYGLDRPASGIGRFTIELAQALARFPDELAIMLLTPFSGSPAGLDRLYPSVRLRGRLLPSLMSAGPPQIAAIARRAGLRVVHDPFGVSPFLVPHRIAPFARVVTIHDMVPFIYPETHARLTNWLFRHYIPRTLRFVDQVVTVSEASRRDIQRYYGMPASKIRVIPNGVSPAFTPVPPTAVAGVLRRYAVPQSYILTVGALQARKNLETLFAAYRVLRCKGLPHRLVVTGRKAWKAAGIFTSLQQLGLEEDVILTGYVADEDLPALYSGAAAFAFPSLYEGFGLPPLEAMACGTPVVTSNRSSLPEVVGTAGLTVEPSDVRGFASALERLLTDAALHEACRERGLARASRFTWDAAAAEYLDLYRSLAARRKDVGSALPVTTAR
ncbi:Glycosyltransferase [Nitrolancea hollandica Lb]|uniref:Glycosyltransferase n=1 Tax=Nitrolancea hollandica Lb TaxID=1129897 RepID=I4EEP3_9BACT|nr:Glycosyltransferase [Nitrolancea hollandica Lb]